MVLLKVVTSPLPPNTFAIADIVPPELLPPEENMLRRPLCIIKPITACMTEFAIEG
ncbi:MAG TPA: hypothetical protein VF884_13295 [Nitrososphaeraceae archaeon]